MLGHFPRHLCQYAASLVAALALLVGTIPCARGSDLRLVELIAAGRIDDARAHYAVQNPSLIDWLFFDARVAKANGEFDTAIAMFRKVLRYDPGYIAARRELAHSLLLAEDYKASTHHFRHLMRIDPNKDQRRAYIRFLDDIARLRPFSFGVRFAVVSSSNINRGSSQDTFKPGRPNAPSFDITSKAEPGTGVELGFTARHLWQRTNGYSWQADWDLAIRQFDDSGQNSVTASTRLHYARLTENAHWSLGPTLRRTWTTATQDERLDVGVSASADWRIKNGSTLFFLLSAENRDYLNDDARDGPIYWIQAGVARPVTNGHLAVGVRLTVNRPNLDHIRYDGQSAFAHLSHNWAGGLQGALGLEVGRRDYAGPFPFAGVPRGDTFVQITVSAQHDAIRVGRFMPSLNCTLGSTSSNIAFHDHDIEECTIGIVTRF